MKRPLAEYLGTFLIVFAGTGAIIVDQANGGVIGHTGIALVFGLAVFVAIHTFGDVSGAHLNPAVTLGLTLARRFPPAEAGGYVIAQLAGAFSASGLLRLIFPASPALGATLPVAGIAASFTLEAILTAVLMLVILSAATGNGGRRTTAAFAIGGTIGLSALFAGPISGASLNPARSLAPAIVGGHTTHLWLYPAATLLGAIAAVPLCIAIHRPGCCRP